MHQSDIKHIASKFSQGAEILDAKLIEEGNINKTFLISAGNNEFKYNFILQRISPIFISPFDLVRNHELVIKHLSNRVNIETQLLQGRSFAYPSLLRCNSSRDNVFQLNSSYWRGIKFIEFAETINVISGYKSAYEIGYGLALFQYFLSDIKKEQIIKTINNFHNTDFYIQCYEKVYKNITKIKPADIDLSVRLAKANLFFRENINRVRGFQKEIALHVNRKFVIHGDPKMSNFMFNIKDNRFSAIIDFDTISVGYLLTDLSDCLRSACNLSGEDPNRLEDVNFDLQICKYILEGYCSVPSNLISRQEFICLPHFTCLIIFELGIRFLTDFLESNRYFNVEYSSQNLYRAEVQFRLFDVLISRWDEFKYLVNQFCL